MRMWKAEWRKLTGRPLAIITVIGLLFVPFFYGLIFLSAYWDPYSKTEQLPVAVVNQDAGADYYGTHLNVGQNLVEHLKESRTFDWSFPDKAAALKGLEEESYYLVIEVPANFSQAAATVMNEQPQKMQLHYYTNPGKSYPAAQIASSAMVKISEQVQQEVIKQYAKSLFDSLRDVSGAFTRAADGAASLAQGSQQLEGGSAELSRRLSELADSTLAFKDGASQLQAGASGLQAGASKLSAGLESSRGGAEQLQQQLAGLAAGLEQAAAAAQGLTASGGSGAGSAAEQLQPLAEQLARLAAGGQALSAAAGQLAQGQAQLAAGAAQLDAGSGELAGGVGRLGRGAAALHDGAGQLAAGAAKLTKGAADVRQGADELHSGLQSGAEQTGVHADEATYEMFAAPLELQAQKLNDVTKYGVGLAPYIISIALFAGALMFSSAYSLKEPAVRPTSAWSWLLSKLLVVALVSIGSSFLIDTILLGGLGLEVQSVWRFYLFTALTSLTFFSLILFLFVALNTIGQYIAFLILLLQIGGSAGTFPQALTPPFFQAIHPYLPMTFSIGGFREIISIGTDYAFMWRQAAVLGMYAVIFILLAYGALGLNMLRSRRAELREAGPAGE